MTTDSDIIRRSASEPSAFAEIFERHAGAVGHFVARRVGGEFAEDILSETFLVAFRRREDFDLGRDSAKPWLFGIAERLLRKYRVEQARQWRDLAAAATRHDAVAREGDTGPLARLDASAAAALLAPAIARLAEKDRETLLLYAWGDLTYEEVAQALGVPVGTVRSRLNRVRKRLAAHDDYGAAHAVWQGTE